MNTFSIKSLALAYERRVQTFTEMTIMMTTLCFMAFNIVSVEDNFSLGYYTISIIGTYISICALLIIANLLSFVYSSLRFRLAMRAYRSSRKQLAINLRSTRALRKQRNF